MGLPTLKLVCFWRENYFPDTSNRCRSWLMPAIDIRIHVSWGNVYCLVPSHVPETWQNIPRSKGTIFQSVYVANQISSTSYILLVSKLNRLPGWSSPLEFLVSQVGQSQLHMGPGNGDWSKMIHLKHTKRRGPPGWTLVHYPSNYINHGICLVISQSNLAVVWGIYRFLKYL